MAVRREKVERLSEILDLYRYIQPENSEEEREEFLTAVDEGRTYNPTYTYPDFSSGGEARDLLQDVSSAAEDVLEDSMVESLRGRLEMIEAIGTEAIARRSREHYGFPDEELVRRAREKFIIPKEPDSKDVDGQLLEEAFISLFDELGIDYSCGISDVDIIRNSPADRSVLIPSGKRYSREAAKRLLVHESTHSLRSVNGQGTGSIPLSQGTSGHEAAEEGLATFNEREVGAAEGYLPRITARVVAVAESDKNFHSLYSTMRDMGLGRRRAFIRTYRVKRGLEDTSKPGGFMKDHIYFQGYTFLERDPALAPQLYAGKIGFEELGEVEAEPEVSRESHLDACRRVCGRILD